ncbi:MAG: aminotransferase class I/II-fold pyridoxal phosphate-dependent enzyme [Bacteroidetes bacterium]|nr:aminotransferase class I/II-fold pyridoxal phosphate-dependent enzyme [Bacteroidota bacterium]
MMYKRMAIEKESPEEMGYSNIRYNLAESSVTDFILKDISLGLQDLSLCYTDHRGKPELRELICAGHKNLDKNDVLLTVGAASALFIIASSLLTSADHLIVVHPNYATNIETPRAIGSAISYISLSFENAWQPDIAALEKAVQANTKYISITHPHNPTGMMLSRENLDKIIRIAEQKGIYVLVDETYRELSLTSPYPLAASLSSHAISVSSVSKAYGLPGLRLGWLVTKNEELMEKFLAAKEQIFITNSVLDEEIALQFLLEKERYWKSIKAHIQTNFSLLEKWIQAESRLEWIKPGGGVVCFPRVKDAANFNTERFYDLLLRQYGTMVGPGHWFEMPDHYMRMGYAWPGYEDLAKGLAGISAALDKSFYS